MSHDPARQIARSARQIEDAAERSAYLDRVCRGITRLRADVDRILAEPGADEPVAPPDAAAAAPAPATRSDGSTPTRADVEPSDAPDPGAGKPGDTIGRYRLVKELGQGGFGAVWLADQFQPVRRQVALKIIKVGMDTVEVVARFEQERQALALMDHPNVARVLDAGATASGRPYFVMDLVQGVPIHEFCDAERLSVRERLELFAQVCAAVQHAHMKGIIHRDLKPSNVLVARRDGAPHATVIDFGIAKATSSKLTERSLVTEAYQVIGTLQYMSPEQSQASPDIDTRADVYSLGVILYELMTGSTPYDREAFERGALAEILRMIAEHEPPPPSARITASRDTRVALAETRSVAPERLASQVRGELDWIVMRAIEKDRTRRYESAEALAADIRRYLTGEPVSAAPPSAAYRLRKLVRRHKGAVAAAAAVAASLVAGVIAFAWQAGVARDERDAAVRAREAESVERKRSEDVAGLMESLFQGISPDDDSGGDLRSRLVERLSDVAHQLDAGTGDPIVGARIRLAIGSTYMGLAVPQEAEPQYRAALDALRKHAAPDDPRIGTATLGLAAAVEKCGGRFAEAAALIEEARAESAARGGAGGMSAEDFDHMLGMVRQAEGRLDLAIPLFEAAVARVEQRGGPWTRDDLLVLHTLATAYRDTGRPDEAVTRLREVLARRRELLGDDHSDTLMTANSLAVSLSAAGRNEEALALQQETLELLLRRRAPEHAAVLNCQSNMAGTLNRLRRHDEAIAMLEKVCRVAAGRFPPDSPDRVRPSMALVAAYSAAGRHAEAARVFDAVRPSMWTVYGPAHDSVVELTADFAGATGRGGDAPRAVAWLEQGIEAAEKARGPDDEAVLKLRSALGAVLRNSGDAARAAEILGDVVERLVRTRGADDPVTLSAMHYLGCAQFSLRQGEVAAKTFEQVLAGRRAKLGEDHAETLQTEGCLGSAYWLSGRLDKSVPILADTLARQERTLGADSDAARGTAVDLAVNLNDAKDFEQLVLHLGRWLPHLLRSPDAEKPVVQSMTSAFLSECRKSGRQADAAPVFEAIYENALRSKGADDEETLKSGANLAACLWAAGALDRSLPLLEDVYALRKRVSGVDDPDTLHVASSLAVNLRDAGRTDEAVALFEDTIRRDLAVSGPASPEGAFLRREYARALHRAGRSADAAATMREFTAGARRRSPPGSVQLATDLVQAGQGMLEFGVPAEAETLLRECVDIRAKADPTAWSTHSARSLLGAALLAQRRFAEAEPLITASAEALIRPDAKVPAGALKRVDDARERVLRLYTEWDAAEPGKGHDAKLAEWKAKFEAEAAAPGGK